MKFTTLLLPVAALLSLTSAQSDCLKNCLTQAGSATGCTQANCACTNQAFQGQVESCVKSCPAADQQQAQQLQSSSC